MFDVFLSEKGKAKLNDINNSEEAKLFGINFSFEFLNQKFEIVKVLSDCLLLKPFNEKNAIYFKFEEVKLVKK